MDAKEQEEAEEAEHSGLGNFAGLLLLLPTYVIVLSLVFAMSNVCFIIVLYLGFSYMCSFLVHMKSYFSCISLKT